MGGMKGPGARIALVLAMPLLIVPLAALTWLAARGVDQQESSMRARLRESLLLEVGQTNGRIRAWFDDMPGYLGEGAPGQNSGGRPRAAELAAWKEREPLVGIPFLLDAGGSIVYPEAAKTGSPDDETRRFYWRYLNVFGNQEPIPVYRNIAEEYEASIVGRASGEALAAPDPATGAWESATAESAPAENGLKSGMAESAPTESAPAADDRDAALHELVVAESEQAFAQSDVAPSENAPSTSERAFAPEESAPIAAAPAQVEKDAGPAAPAVSKSAPSPRSVPARKEGRAVQSKTAQSLFESDVEVQRQVYDLAAEEGKETLKRKVNPRIDAANTRESAAPRSVYIE